MQSDLLPSRKTINPLIASKLQDKASRESKAATFPGSDCSVIRSCPLPSSALGPPGVPGSNISAPRFRDLEPMPGAARRERGAADGVAPEPATGTDIL